MYRRKDRYLISQFISKQQLGAELDIVFADNQYDQISLSCSFEFSPYYRPSPVYKVRYSFCFLILALHQFLQLYSVYFEALRRERDEQARRLSLLREFSKVYGIEAHVLIDELGSLGFKFDAKVAKAFRDSIEEEKKHLLIIVRERDKLKGKIKALSSPLQIIPQSLHPIESLAH